MINVKELHGLVMSATPILLTESKLAFTKVPAGHAAFRQSVLTENLPRITAWLNDLHPVVNLKTAMTTKDGVEWGSGYDADVLLTLGSALGMVTYTTDDGVDTAHIDTTKTDIKGDLPEELLERYDYDKQVDALKADLKNRGWTVTDGQTRRTAWEATKDHRGFTTPLGFGRPRVTISAHINTESGRHEIHLGVVGPTSENFNVVSMVFAGMEPTYDVVSDALTVAAYSWTNAVLASSMSRHQNAMDAIVAVKDALKKPLGGEAGLGLEESVKLALRWHGFHVDETDAQPEAKKE